LAFPFSVDEISTEELNLAAAVRIGLDDRFIVSLFVFGSYNELIDCIFHDPRVVQAADIEEI
jgi:hypothetical protein